MSYVLTTIDNPWNYFTQFDEWLSFDIEKGYKTCERLARNCQYSNDMTEKEEDLDRERAIDKIIANDLENIYIKVDENYDPKNLYTPSTL